MFLIVLYLVLIHGYVHLSFEHVELFETYLWISFEPLSSLILSFRVCLGLFVPYLSRSLVIYVYVVINHQKGGDCKHLGPQGMFR
jgi:hypothetical protein